MRYFKKENIKEISKVLKNGGLVAFPTETVFGLACIASNEYSYERLKKVKRRNPNKPFTIMCSNLEQAKRYIEIDKNSLKIFKKFTPGPLTIVLKAKKNTPFYLDLGTGFIGIRIPDDDFVINLIEEIGEGLLVPSANISSFPPALDSNEVFKYFKDEIDGIVEGECKNKIASTVIKVDGNNVLLLREGIIKLEDIKGALL